MKKLIVTLMAGLLLSFSIIGVSASEGAVVNQRMQRGNRRQMMRNHHRRMNEYRHRRHRGNHGDRRDRRDNNRRDN